MYTLHNRSEHILVFWNMITWMVISNPSFYLIEFSFTFTVVDRKDWTLHRAIEVKLPWLRAVPAGQEWILPLEKWAHFFLGPWLLVCQFLDISNQMETTGEVSNIKRIFLCNRPLYKFFCSTLDTSPVDSIWLEMSINWHTKSQGPNKKCTHFSRGMIHSCPAGTARN